MSLVVVLRVCVRARLCYVCVCVNVTHDISNKFVATRPGQRNLWRFWVHGVYVRRNFWRDPGRLAHLPSLLRTLTMNKDTLIEVCKLEGVPVPEALFWGVLLLFMGSCYQHHHCCHITTTCPSESLLASFPLASSLLFISLQEALFSSRSSLLFRCSLRREPLPSPVARLFN